MSGFPDIANLIKNADAGGVRPGWSAIKAILSGLNTAAANNSIKYASDTSALNGLSGTDAAFVAVENVGLYHYSPINTYPIPNGGYPAFGGGRWDLLLALNKGPYVKIIGDSTTTSFTIKHDRNSLFPTVLLADTLNYTNNGDPFGYVTTGTVQIIDANTITVAFQAPPATQSITTIVKP